LRQTASGVLRPQPIDIEDKWVEASEIGGDYESRFSCAERFVTVDDALMQPHPAGAKKLDSLTSLRFFAAFGVVIHHLMGWQIPPVNINFGVGVSFFFVLSGFILTYVYRSPQDKLRSYYVARVARIIPLHIATLLFAGLFLAPGYTVRGPFQFIQNLLLLQSWTPTFATIFSYNHVAWTLSVEMFFYLIFPAIIVLKRAFLPVFLLSTLLLLSILAFLDTTAAASVASETGFSTSALVQSYPIFRVFEFLMGVGCALLFLRTSSFAFSDSVATATEAGCIILFLGVAFFYNSSLQSLGNIGVGPSMLNWLSEIGYSPVFTLLIFVFAYEAGAVTRALRWRPLVILGVASFALYMTHQLIFRLFGLVGWGQDGPSLFWCTTLIGTCLVTALLAWRFIERPGRGLVIGLNQFLLSLGSRRPRVSSRQPATQSSE